MNTLIAILLSHSVFCADFGNKRFVSFDLYMDQSPTTAKSADFLVYFSTPTGTQVTAYHWEIPAGSPTHVLLNARVPAGYDVSSYTLTSWGEAE